MNYDLDTRPSPTATVREYDTIACEGCAKPIPSDHDSEFCDPCEDAVRRSHGCPPLESEDHIMSYDEALAETENWTFR